MTVDWKNIFLSIRSVGVMLLFAIIINVSAIVLFSVFIVLLFVALMILASLTPVPSDAEMIALLTERRATFDLLVTKVREERLAGTIGRRTLIGGRNDDKEWADEVRELMRVVGIAEIHYKGPNRRMILAYSDLGGGGSKDFIYDPSPISPPPGVTDLHGKDGPDRARAVLCHKDRRADLRHLCTMIPRVNDLDILEDYYEGGAQEAERPIDGHWSLRLFRLR